MTEDQKRLVQLVAESKQPRSRKPIKYGKIAAKNRGARMEVFCSPEEREQITQEAIDQGIPRHELLYNRVIHPSGVVPDPSLYADCVTAAARAYSGLPRTELERIVSAVIKTLLK